MRLQKEDVVSGEALWHSFHFHVLTTEKNNNNNLTKNNQNIINKLCITYAVRF